MKSHNLGHSNLEISVIRLDCKGMPEFYGSAKEAESIPTLHRLSQGVMTVTLIKTEDINDSDIPLC